jgi:hypothetical protein
MPFVRLPGGQVAHVRMSKPRRRRCKVCGHATDERFLRECDFTLPNGKTCDLLMCDKCAFQVKPNFDLCPEHSPERVFQAQPPKESA